MTPARPKFGSLKGVSAVGLTLALVGVAGLSTALVAEPAKPAGSAAIELPNGAPTSFADLVDRVKPAVVSVQVQSTARMHLSEFGQPPFGPEFPFFFGEPNDGRPAPMQQSLGSGFVVDPAGYIVTNYHVIDGAENINITLTDGRSLSAEIVGQDQKTDLALLKVDAEKPLPHVTFAKEQSVRVGDWVVAVGNPFGLGGTVTTGVVSALGRDLGASPYADFIQIDAAINQGNSGGPAFNLKGEVIGVNTAIFSPNGGSVGIGFAVAADTAEDIIAQLREDGDVDRGWLGVRIQEVTPDIALSLGLDGARGALVTDVFSGSPAAKAGLKVGDVILSLNKNKIDNVRMLSKEVARLQSGERADLDVLRNDQQKTLKFRVGQQEKAATKTPKKAALQKSSFSDMGLELAPLPANLADHLGLSPSDGGVLIENVRIGSEAAKKGIRPGHVLLSIDNVRLQSPADAQDALHKAKSKKKEAVLFQIQTAQAQQFVALKLEARAS